ncbi:MAG: hypothetical protein JST26_08580 [Bacteroidetes bacterium]|nr:hypothetical protein [Bacteroidota bacterium]
MIKRIFLCFLVIAVLPGIIKSQAPGYIGKRFQVGYGFYLSPAFMGSTYQGNSIFGYHSGNANRGTFACNTIHEGFVEYALKKRLMIGVSVRYFRTSFDNSVQCFVYDAEASSQGASVSFVEFPSGLYYITGLNYQIYNKLYFKKYIAPWGRYLISGISLRTFTCRYNPDEMFLSASSNFGQYSNKKYSDFGPQQQKFMRFDIMAGFGRNRVFGNRISVDYGFNTGLIGLFTSLFDAIGPESLSDNLYTQANYMKKTSVWRVRGVNRLNAFIKIGYLF